MTSTPTPASAGLRVGAAAVDLAVAAAAAGAGYLLTHSPGVAALVAGEAGLALWLGHAATGRTPGALATRTVAYREGTDHAPGLRLRGVRVADLRPAPAEVVHVDAYGRETATAPGWTAPSAVKAPPAAVTAAPELAPVVPAPARPSGPLVLGGRPAAPSEPLSPGATPAATLASATSDVPVVPIASEPPVVPAPALASEQEVKADVPGSLWLVTDAGQRCEVRGTVVVGRAPEASATSGEVAFAVEDSTRSLSRNHARIGRDDDGLWIEDAHSSNGTALQVDGGDVVAVTPGTRVRLEPGTTVLLGDRTLEVTRA